MQIRICDELHFALKFKLNTILNIALMIVYEEMWQFLQ